MKDREKTYVTSPDLSFDRVKGPAWLLEIDRAAPHDLPSECVIELPPTERRPDGTLVFFEAQLSPSVSLSTRPGLVEPDNSWTSPLWLFPANGVLPRELRFRFEARRRIRLDWPR